MEHTKKKSALTGILILLLFHSANLSINAKPADDQEVEVAASDTAQLKQLLEDQKVEAILRDGTSLKGRVVEVRDGTLAVQVERSEGPSAPAKGLRQVPTARLSTVTITKIKGKKRAILGTTLAVAGAGLGLLMVATEFAGESWNGTYGAVTTATTAGGAAAGYFLGRQLDKKRVTIVIR